MGWTVGGSEPVLPPGGFPKLSPPRPPAMSELRGRTEEETEAQVGP